MFYFVLHSVALKTFFLQLLSFFNHHFLWFALHAPPIGPLLFHLLPVTLTSLPHPPSRSDHRSGWSVAASLQHASLLPVSCVFLPAVFRGRRVPSACVCVSLEVPACPTLPLVQVSSLQVPPDNYEGILTVQRR